MHNDEMKKYANIIYYALILILLVSGGFIFLFFNQLLSVLLNILDFLFGFLL
jgi:hypothetical protein